MRKSQLVTCAFFLLLAVSPGWNPLRGQSGATAELSEFGEVLRGWGRSPLHRTRCADDLSGDAAADPAELARRVAIGVQEEWLRLAWELLRSDGPDAAAVSPPPEWVEQLDGEWRVESMGESANRWCVRLRRFYCGVAVRGGEARVLVSRESREVSYLSVRVGALPPPTWGLDPTRHQVWVGQRGGVARFVRVEQRGGESHYYDIDTEQLVARESGIHGLDFVGEVWGMRNSGTTPDTGPNSWVEAPVAGAAVTILGGATAVADAAGAFSVTATGATATLSVSLDSPQIVVTSATGSDVSVSLVANASSPSLIDLTPIPTAEQVAQLNAYAAARGAYDFFLLRQPDLDIFDAPLTIHVNEFGSCGAYYSTFDQSLHFTRQGGLCANSAYSTVVVHELGHLIVDRLGLGQGAFGEGYGDALSVLVYDDSLIGRDFFGPGTWVRDVAGIDVSVPCMGDDHYCGRVLSGCWWDLKLALQDQSGLGEGLELCRQLFVDWSLMTLGNTLGGNGNESADAGTLLELLTVDDDNGDLSDGTPHMTAIFDAFATHGISADPTSWGVQWWTRGDCNQDASLGLIDAIHLLEGVFLGGNLSCARACDANDDGAVSLVDAIVLLHGVFLGEVLPAPYPNCGSDPTTDSLPCVSGGICF